MSVRFSDRTISEPARKLKVWRETELVILGGGPAGIAAAVAAARNGWKQRPGI